MFNKSIIIVLIDKIASDIFCIHTNTYQCPIIIISYVENKYFACIYRVDCTCIMFAHMYTEVADRSNGNHEIRTISRLITMRTVDWVKWNNIVNQKPYFVRRWMIGMYPAFVKYPVSGSLVGRSSHVNESVSLSRSPISRLR